MVKSATSPSQTCCLWNCKTLWMHRALPCEIDGFETKAIVNQQLPAHHKGWMMGGQVTLFHQVPGNYGGYLSCCFYYLPTNKPTCPYICTNHLHASTRICLFSYIPRYRIFPLHNRLWQWKLTSTQFGFIHTQLCHITEASNGWCIGGCWFALDHWSLYR
jgi:hypothetical protein